MDSLEREYAAACRTDLAPLTAAEQEAVRHLAGDLPTVWAAPTTTPADRKRLLRLAIQDVTVTVLPTKPRSAALTIHWSGGATTQQTVTVRPTGWHCTTEAALVEQIRTWAQQWPDHQIAERLAAAGLRTQTGKPWTYRRVASLRKQHQIPTACPIDPTVRTERGDGLIPVARAAEQLGVSHALIHVWIQQGVLTGEQRVSQSYRWVRLTEADRARLAGQRDWSHFPTVRQVMREQGASRAEVWDQVRTGAYRAYRHPIGRCWEWRLEARLAAPASSASPSLVATVLDASSLVAYD